MNEGGREVLLILEVYVTSGTTDGQGSCSAASQTTLWAVTALRMPLSPVFVTSLPPLNAQA